LNEFRFWFLQFLLIIHCRYLFTIYYWYCFLS